MNTKIRNQHKKLAAIFSMIEKCDSIIATLKMQLEKYPTEIFWCNEHAKLINRYKRIRERLYAYYASSFAAMAVIIAEKAATPPKPPTGNYIRERQVFVTEHSNHLPIFS